MTPAEEIQEAVTKLDGLRAAATYGEWHAWKAIRGHGYVYGIENGAGKDLAIMSEGDARLIVALHRTIPALLAVLATAHETDALGLARAINGDGD